MTKGALYIVHGFDHDLDVNIKRFLQSVQSLKSHCNLPVTLCTFDRVISQIDLPDGVDTIIMNPDLDLPERRMRGGKGMPLAEPKIHYMNCMPYDTTLYVDTDTWFFQDPSEIMSTQADISCCREVSWGYWSPNSIHKAAASPLSNRFNTGVMVLNDTPAVAALFNKAKDIFADCERNNHYERGLYIGDQWSLNEAVRWICDLTFTYLPVRWNVRRPMIGKVENPAIVHCKRGMKWIIKAMNS